MRRGTDGTRKVHIAVWSIKTEAATALRKVVEQDSDSEAIKGLRQELGDALMNILAETEISWCRVMEERPEIIVRRDVQSPLAYFRNKRVLVLGCGALGSWSAEIVARAGAAQIDLVDNAIVKPGLLARQDFQLDDIGANKATALSKRLRALVSSNVVIQDFASDAHHFAVADRSRFEAYDVVVDCTASNIVQMLLERDWQVFQLRTPAFISMITDAKAMQGLCVALPRNSASGPWDAYIRLKYRVCVGSSDAEIINAFYDPAGMKGLFQPEPGCSDPTFSGSMADVVGIASSSLNFACQHGLARETEAAAAFRSFGNSTSKAEILNLDAMTESVAGNYRVRIARRVNREARGWARQNARIRTPAHETGGLLWGMWDDAVGVVWVFDASGPPPDSAHSPAHFICGVEGTVAEHEKRMALTRGTTGFVGFWHTHPDMPSYQSGVDVAGMAKLVSGLGHNQKRCLMLIFGRTGARPTAGVYVYESRGSTDKGELVVAGSAQSPLEMAVV